MRSLAIQPGPSHKTAAKPFAKFVLLASSLMVLAGCNPGDWRAQFNQRMVLQQQQGEDRDIVAQRKLIHGRLLQRKSIVDELRRAWEFPGLDHYKAQLISELTVHGTVSQVAGEYDTAVIKCLGICASGLGRIPATEAVEQLIAISSICPDQSMSRRVATGALRGARENPALSWGTRERIARSLKKDTPPLLAMPEMPPCCVSAGEPGQTRVDSLALRILAER